MNQRFIIYAKETMEETTQLQAAMSLALRSSDVCWCGSLEEFLEKFHSPQNFTEAILLIESRNDLKHLISNQYLIDGLRIFMILPDNSNETSELAHKLYPRFITFSDSEFTGELTAIIRNVAVMKDKAEKL